MARETPNEFHMKDLFMDVKLEACVNGTTYDYLGRKLFSTEFFRKGIGFGITNIDIEVNTSLQPLVKITFKDLYGATIFGGQKGVEFDDNQSIDYSTIFNWPPPKFIFSFKGYLGAATTWVLNLKRTSTSFNSSDGSYNLECEFVPNQWGFFADLPFLYLLAAKRLRKDRLGPDATQEAIDSITSVFDLIKIGKQVELKTQDTTKEYDGLVKQLGALKSNTARALTVSSLADFGEIIDGVVNNRRIGSESGEGLFIQMKMPELGNLPEEINTQDKIELKLGNPRELAKLNAYLILSIGFASNPSETDPKNLKFNDGFGGITKDYASFNPNDEQVAQAKNNILQRITDNLDAIDDQVRRTVFNTSEKKLEKITIGEIFGQLGADAGFIIGSILDSGLEGYRKNQDERDRLVQEGRLIGEAFPMVINENGEEVPALQQHAGTELGVNAYEMDFVRRFVNAISEGIARDLITDNGSIPGNDDGVLKQRVNNIEMAEGNPYKPFYTNIATNILVRGGIVGYITRSNDPNLPGDYGNSWYDYFDKDSRQYIEEIAVRDASNITESMLKSLSETDTQLLKRFCNFFERFYNEDGEYLLVQTGENQGDDGDEITGPSAADYPVIMQLNPDITLTFKQLWTELKKPNLLEGASLQDGVVFYPTTLTNIETPTYPSSFFTEQLSDAKDAQNPLSFVDDETYEATRITNNGLSYAWPTVQSNEWWMVAFVGEANKTAQEVNTAPSDAEFRNGEKDSQDWVGSSQISGYAAINSKTNEDGVLGRVNIFEEYVNAGRMFDHEAMKNPQPDFYDETALGEGLQQFAFNGVIAEDAFEADQLAANGNDDVFVAGNIGYTVAGHSYGSDGLVFGLFSNDTKSINQRIFIRKVCQTLNQEIEKVEDERNQVIGSVLGKAGENENAIYKQMHTLYYQWQSLSYSDEGGCSNPSENEFNNATVLEAKFGDNHRDMIGNDDIDDNGETKSLTNPEQAKQINDGTFVYDYPLQRIKGPVNGRVVRVRDSIINLEPLYKPNGRTTILNIIQQVCTKNNFLFVPIPGNPGYLDVKDMYAPSQQRASASNIRNFFHVLFTPTPESRAKKTNGGDPLALSENHKTYNTNSFVIKYGHPDNQIVSNIQVGTADNKVTAESIVNLQRLVDNENQNKKVTTDCSMLPVLAGRSYNASVEMLGNAQVYPMQFFYLENSPLFGGLYQVMKVTHSITPNNFKTTAEGMRMRFTSDYGAIEPITLQTFRDLGKLQAPLAVSEGLTKADRNRLDTGGGEGQIDDSANTPIGDYSRSEIEQAVKDANHKWFDSSKDYELNIVGIRNSATGKNVTNKFDDLITVSYKENGQWKFWSWKATTQPGKKWVVNNSVTYGNPPETIKRASGGVAILKPGQYKDSHYIGKHNGQYEALRQLSNVIVYRDDNNDLIYDEKKTETGVFGINIHRAGSKGTTTNVDLYSAGCQVFANAEDFAQFMQICYRAKAANGNVFTYTLLESKDIPAIPGETATTGAQAFTNVVYEYESQININV